MEANCNIVSRNNQISFWPRGKHKGNTKWSITIWTIQYNSTGPANGNTHFVLFAVCTREYVKWANVHDPSCNTSRSLLRSCNELLYNIGSPIYCPSCTCLYHSVSSKEHLISEDGYYLNNHRESRVITAYLKLIWRHQLYLANSN
jgi:hypothetical protein